MLLNHDNGSYTSTVYDMIIDDILNGVLKEGDKLNEKALISKFGFSRTPIREAMIMLERDGFIKTIGREGTYVRRLTHEDVREIYIAREALECMAAKIGVRTISDESLSVLENIVNKMDSILEQRDYDNFVRWDLIFHKAIVDSCHIKLLSKLCYNLGLLGASIRLRGEKYQERIDAYQREHREIYEAFVNRDEILAEQLIRNHVTHGKMDVLLGNEDFLNT